MADGPVLLSGGNPQIPKGDGPAPVEAYLAAMPGWKQDAGRLVDRLVTELVPDATRAVRWNSPFWGVEGQGWFASIHCFTRYVKVSFFAGVELVPEPPVAGKDARVRYVHLDEGAAWDEAQLAEWIGQAARLPGWDGS